MSITIANHLLVPALATVETAAETSAAAGSGTPAGDQPINSGTELFVRILDGLGVTDPWLYAVLFLVLSLAVCGAVFISWISLVALAAIYYERKVSGWMQSRRGPLHVGPRGVLQTLADGLKLITKEDLVPAKADRFLFNLAPTFVFIAVVGAFVCVPFSNGLVMANLNVGVVFILAVSSISVVGVMLAGWSSNNKWALYGGLREAAQMVSYEIPMGLIVLSVTVYAGTLDLSEIIRLQHTGGLFGLIDADAYAGILSWNIFRSPFMLMGFVVFYVAMLASAKRAPFDLPEAESELVAGFLTEYSGIRWAYFFLAEYGEMYVFSALGVGMFLGGWDIGIPWVQGALNTWGASGDLADVVVRLIGAVVFIGKATMLMFVMMWLRWTLPRVRLDQVMHICLKVLLPFSLIFLVLNTVWALLTPAPTFG